MSKNDPMYRMIGASNHAPEERQIHDLYATSYGAVKPMLDKLSDCHDKLPRHVWENSVGFGHIAESLTDNGFYVSGTDIQPFWAGSEKDPWDFLVRDDIPKELEGQDFSIIGNPPYKHLTKFVLRSLDFLNDGSFLIQFLKTSTLESRKRYDQIYKDNPPKYIFQFINRVKSSKNGEFSRGESSAIPYSWFVWQKGFKGRPQIHWIESDESHERDLEITKLGLLHEKENHF